MSPRHRHDHADHRSPARVRMELRSAIRRRRDRSVAQHGRRCSSRPAVRPRWHRRRRRIGRWRWMPSASCASSATIPATPAHGGSRRSRGRSTSSATTSRRSPAAVRCRPRTRGRHFATRLRDRRISPTLARPGSPTRCAGWSWATADHDRDGPSSSPSAPDASEEPRPVSFADAPVPAVLLDPA